MHSKGPKSSQQVQTALPFFVKLNYLTSLSLNTLSRDQFNFSTTMREPAEAVTPSLCALNVKVEDTGRQKCEFIRVFLVFFNIHTLFEHL